MIVWRIIDKNGRILKIFTEQIEARKAQRWFREHFPQLLPAVLPLEICEKWEEP